MATFRSSDELFEAVRNLIEKLEWKGHRQAASELKEGFACLNGLTDGWAAFLDSIKIAERDASDFDHDDRASLKKIRVAVNKAVHRR